MYTEQIYDKFNHIAIDRRDTVVFVAPNNVIHLFENSSGTRVTPCCEENHKDLCICLCFFIKSNGIHISIRAYRLYFDYLINGREYFNRNCCVLYVSTSIYRFTEFVLYHIIENWGEKKIDLKFYFCAKENLFAIN